MHTLDFVLNFGHNHNYKNSKKIDKFWTKILRTYIFILFSKFNLFKLNIIFNMYYKYNINIMYTCVMYVFQHLSN